MRALTRLLLRIRDHDIRLAYGGNALKHACAASKYGDAVGTRVTQQSPPHTAARWLAAQRGAFSNWH